MATVTAKTLIAEQYAPNAVAALYTATNCRTLIDKFTGCNDSAANVTVSVHIVPGGGAATASNRFVKNRGIAPDETYTFPELVGKQLESGYSLHVVCSAASALVVGTNGREITS